MIFQILLHVFMLENILCTEYNYDYIVLGSGPAGLQMGYLLKTARRDYIVLDKASISGNFFTTYPRHGTLISLNKRNTGQTNKEFNMRHDWNSLLSHDESLQIRHYSKKMFPPKDALLKYLNDFEKKLAINVRHNVEVSNVDNKENNVVTMSDQNGNVYKCKTLIIATGLWKPNIPKFEGHELSVGYEEISLDPDDYEGKSVMILGNGNSAFEIADSIYGSTNYIHMVGRNRIKLSWETHYVGDLRAVNNALLDTYQLKSLDAILEGDTSFIKLEKNADGKIKLYLLDDDADLLKRKEAKLDEHDNFSLRKSYDMVIRALGWKFDDSIFHNKSKLSWSSKGSKKFPQILHDYRAVSFKNIYFAGALAHSLDHRKSAGGFIHGFRYTARALHHILEFQNHGNQWPHLTLPIDQLLTRIIKRLNEASGIYQMFSVLCDVILIENDGKTFSYYEEFPVRLVQRFAEYTGHGSNMSNMIVMVFEYGANFSGPGKDVFGDDRASGDPSSAHTSNFLHPVFYYYKTPPTREQILLKDRNALLPKPDRLHHIVEDFLTEFNAPQSHVLPLRRFIETIINQDMRNNFAEDCMKFALTYSTLPPSCQDYLDQKTSLLGQHIWDESQHMYLPI